jgi:hypothetical protein
MTRTDYGQYTETAYRPTHWESGICNRFHYRGFSHLSDYSTAWGDDADFVTSFVCRTIDLRAFIENDQQGELFSVVAHGCNGEEKGWKVYPQYFMPNTDRLIAQAEENLANSDLSDEEKADVVALWHSYGWYA